MLVSFAVENWECFRDRQEFSMETLGRASEQFSFETGIRRYHRLNRVAAIYGPNGSGKSRFVSAIGFMQNAVLNSVKEVEAGDRIAVSPFRFSLSSLDSPTCFEITFIQDSTVYEYGFCVDSARVWEEWLSVRRPAGRIQRWFMRRFDSDSEEYLWGFGPSLRGQRETWRKATRSDALFVSTAVQLNSEILTPVVEWFRKLIVIGSGEFPASFTSKRALSDSEFTPRLIEFLQQADIAVEDIKVTEEDINYDEMAEHIPRPVVEFIRKSGDAKALRSHFGLPVEGSKDLSYLDLGEQSDGTRRLYSYADPWLNIIDNDRIVVVDELDQSLHPHLVKYLVGIINRESKSMAQLVATVHDVTLLLGALERNQIWLTEKDLDQAASLVPLSDYKVRKKESLLRGYLGGRYGAVPNVVESDTLE